MAEISLPLAPDEILRFGDVVNLYCDDVGGFMMATSPIDAQIVVQLSDRHTVLPNILNSSFEVLVPDKYKEGKKYAKLVAHLKDKGDRHTMAREHQHNAELRKLQRLAEAEKEDGIQEQRRQRGKPVIYGSTIQLRHKLTGLYLYASAHETSLLQNTSMLMHLDEYPSKNTRFIIMPRFKVRAVGDTVRSGEKISLESVKNPGSYVHTTAETFDSDDYAGHGHEVNASVELSTWTVNLFQRREIEESTAIYAGDAIRLLHKQSESYLAAEGNEHYGVVENAHLRFREPDSRRPHSLLEPTGPSMYWQLELDNRDHAPGHVMRWEMLCRFRHIPTGQYLAVTASSKKLRDEFVVTLIPDRRDAGTVFRLHSVIKNVLEIHNGAFARIEHVLTKRWLHATSADQFPRQRTKKSSGGDSLADLVWDDAKLLYVTAVSDMQYDDVFILHAVAPIDVAPTNFASGLLPTISTYFNRRKRGIDATSRELRVMRNILREITEWLLRDGLPVKSHQKQLRHLMLIDLLIECIFVLSNASKNAVSLEEIAKNPRYRLFLNICAQINVVIDTYLEGDSRKNENYLGQFVPRLLQLIQYGQGYNCAATLTELLEDNQGIVERIRSTDVDFILKVLKKEKDPILLKFLSNLCVCNHVSMRVHQNYICDKLLTESAGMGLLFITDLVDNQLKIRLMASSEPVLLTVFCQNMKDSSTTVPETGMSGVDTYAYFVEQINLLAQLCRGNNEHAIEVITKKERCLTWESLFRGASDDGLPFHLRTSYCDALQYIFVEIGANEPALDRVKTTYIYDTLEQDLYNKNSNDPALSITGCVMPYFPELSQWIIQFLCDNRKGQMASEVDRNLFILSVLELTRCLVSFGYYSDVDDVRELCVPLFSLLNGQLDMPSDMGDTLAPEDEASLQEWRNTDRLKQTKENLAIFKSKMEALEILQLLYNLQFNLRLNQFMFDFKAIFSRNNIIPNMSTLTNLLDQQISKTDAKGYFHYLFNRSDFIKPLTGTTMDLLHDLSNYKYDPLVFKSMKLLHSLYEQHEDIFKATIVGIVLINPRSVAFEASVEVGLVEVKRLIRVRLSNPELERVILILDEFATACELPDDPTIQHAMNQSILYNSGIMNDLFDLLSVKVNLNLPANALLREVHSSALNLLRKMARNNKTIQGRLFRRLGTLMRHVGCEQEMANCVAEIFNNNHELCLKVAEKHVERLVGLLAKFHHPEFLSLLKSVVLIEDLDLPLHRTQTFVVKYVMLQREEILLLISDEENEQRMNLLRGPETRDLDYHLALVDLLATCAEDENKFIESVCQTIFSPEELFEVFMDPVIPMTRKGVYLRFFLYTYLTHGDTNLDEIGLHNLAEDPRLWHFFDQCIVFGERVSSAIEDAQKNKTVLRQSKRNRLVSKANSDLMDFSSPALAAKRRSSSMMAPTEEDIGERFEFLVHSLSPFLIYFCKHIYHKGDVSKSSESRDIMLRLTEVYIRLNQVGHAIIDRPSDQQILANTLTIITPPDHLEMERRIHSVLATQNVNEKPVAAALAQYYLEYTEEETLNERLDNFATNLELSYASQEGCPYKTKDKLPFSDEFKELVEQFVDYGGRNHEFKGLRKSAKRLVTALEESFAISPTKESDRLEHEELRIKMMKVLRALLVNEKRRNAPQESRHAKMAVIQDKLNEFRLPKVLVKFLSSTSDEVMVETLLLFISLLEGGNANVQKSIEDLYRVDHEDQMFYLIKNRMAKSMFNIKERQLLEHTFKKHQREIVDEPEEEPQSHILVQPFLKLGKKKKHKKLPEQSMMEMTQMSMSRPDALNVLAESMFDLRDETATLLFRFLQLLCENFNVGMKDCLRDQPENFRRYNLVLETVNYVLDLSESIEHDTIDLMCQMLETVLEFTSGCVENQSCVFDAQILDALVRIFRTHTFPGVPVPRMAELKNLAGKILLSLFDSFSDSSRVLMGQLKSAIDLRCIHENMNRYHYEARPAVAAALGYNMEDEEEIRPADVGFTFYIILARFGDFFPDEQFSKPPGYNKARNIKSDDLNHRLDEVARQRTPERALKLMADIDFARAPNTFWTHYSEVGSCEILVNDQLQKAYFPRKHHQDLTQSMRDWLIWNMNRSSPSAKVRDIMDKSELLVNEMSHQRRLQAHPLYGPIVRGNELWRDLIKVLTIVINIIMLSTYFKVPNEYAPATDDWVSGAIFGLGAFHCLFCLLSLITLVLEIPPNLPEREKKKKEKPPERFAVLVMRYRYVRDLVKKLLKARYTKPIVIYYILLVAASALGIAFYGYLFSLHFFHMIIRNQTLQRVLSSVTKNGISLLWVALLGVFVIYIYSVASFAFFAGNFDSSGSGSLPISYCTTLWECFLSVLTYGLRGELSSAVPPNDLSNYDDVSIHILYDLTFFIVFSIITINIAIGIIVDTFGQLRDEKQAIEDDLMDNCAICSLKAYDFERHGNGFKTHLKKEHYLWDYIFFFIYLDETPNTEFNALEAYVYKKMKGKSVDRVDFFPVNRALALANTEDNLASGINLLEQRIDTLLDWFKQQDLQREELEEKRRQQSWEQRVKGSRVL